MQRFPPSRPSPHRGDGRDKKDLRDFPFPTPRSGVGNEEELAREKTRLCTHTCRIFAASPCLADAVHMKNIASKGKTAEYCQSSLLSFCIPYAALRRGHKENNKKQKHRAFTFGSLTKCECSRLKKDISFC